MKEYNKKLTEDMYQKWLNGTKVSQLQEENNLGRDAIYKRFARLRQENAQEDVEEVSEIDENDNEVVVHNFTAADNEFDSNDNDDMMPNNDADVLAPEIGNSNNTILYAMIGIGLAIAVVFYGPKVWDALKKWKKRRNNTNEFEDGNMDAVFPLQHPQ